MTCSYFFDALLLYFQRPIGVTVRLLQSLGNPFSTSEVGHGGENARKIVDSLSFHKNFSYSSAASVMYASTEQKRQILFVQRLWPATIGVNRPLHSIVTPRICEILDTYFIEPFDHAISVVTRKPGAFLARETKQLETFVVASQKNWSLKKVRVRKRKGVNNRSRPNGPAPQTLHFLAVPILFAAEPKKNEREVSHRYGVCL